MERIVKAVKRVSSPAPRRDNNRKLFNRNERRSSAKNDHRKPSSKCDNNHWGNEKHSQAHCHTKQEEPKVKKEDVVVPQVATSQVGQKRCSGRSVTLIDGTTACNDG